MTTQDWAISGGMPPELAAEQIKLRRRQTMAEALMEQAMRPLETNRMAGGYVVPVSPFEGAAKLLNTYVAGKRQKDVEKGYTDLSQKYQQGMADAVRQYMQAKQGTPATTETIVDEQANDGEGAPATINAPAVKGDPRAAITQAMMSQYPQLQRIAQMDLTQINRAEDRDEERAWQEKKIKLDGEREIARIREQERERRITKAEADARAAALREDMIRLTASLRTPAQPPAPVVTEIVRDGKTVKIDARTGQVIGEAPATGANKAPAGYRYRTDGSLEPIPGGPADNKVQGAFNADTNALNASEAALNRLGEQVNLVKNSALGRVTGIPGILPNVPGMAGADAQGRLETLRSQVGFTVLQALRDAAKSGSSGLGQVTEREHAMLQAQLGNLQNAQSEPELRRVLGDIAKFVEESKGRLRSAYNMKHRSAPAPGSGASGYWEVVR